MINSNDGAPAVIVAIDEHGQERWRRVDAAKPIAVFDETLVLEGGAVLDASSGRPLYVRAAEEVLLTRDHLLTINSCGGGCLRVSSHDRRGGAPLFSRTVEITGYYLPVATSAGSVILVEDHFRSDLSRPHAAVAELRVYEVAASRTTLHVKQFDDSYYLLEQAVLFDGLLALKHSKYLPNGMFDPDGLRSFALPGVTPALEGWVNRGGSVRGDRSPER